jgi:hypothetical protein
MKKIRGILENDPLMNSRALGNDTTMARSVVNPDITSPCVSSYRRTGIKHDVRSHRTPGQNRSGAM